MAVDTRSIPARDAEPGAYAPSPAQHHLDLALDALERIIEIEPKIAGDTWSRRSAPLLAAQEDAFEAFETHLRMAAQADPNEIFDIGRRRMARAVRRLIVDWQEVEPHEVRVHITSMTLFRDPGVARAAVRAEELIRRFNLAFTGDPD